MPKRSSSPDPDEPDQGDPNVTAHKVVRRATEDEPPTGPEILAELIDELREGIEEGAGSDDLALRLWPRLARLIRGVDRPAGDETARRSRAAAELGRKGGKKGGKARAEKLSPERRSEIARKAAQARWKKEKAGGD